MKAVIQIPALDEEATVGAVIDAVPRSLPGVDAVEVLVVDDGSTDGTADEARRHGAAVVKHSRNRGLGVAFQTGCREALARGADVVVTIDADGQFPAADIPRLVEPVVAGRAGLVTATRFGDPARAPRGIPWIKRWGNGVVARLLGLVAGATYTDVSCGFRAYSREALLRLNLFGDFTYTHETFLSLARQGVAIEEVPVQVTYFPDRRSRLAHSVLRYGWRTIWIIFRSVLDHQPFTVFSALAGLFAAAAALCAAVPGGHWLMSGSFSPYKFLGFAAAFLLAMATLIFCIGLVSDILNRLRLTQERTLYELRARGAAAAPPGEPPKRTT